MNNINDSLIEDNLFGLYRFIGNHKHVTLFDNSDFSAVKTNISFWPNMVFNVNTKASSKERVVSLTEESVIPPFIVKRSSPSIKDSFWEQNNYRLLTKWDGMYINIKNVDFSFLSQNKIKIVKPSKEEIKLWSKIISSELFNKKLIDYNLFSDLNIFDNITLYLGYLNNTPVATCLTFVHNGVPGYYMITTDNKYQKKGFGSYITLYAIYESYKKGYEFGILQATREAKNMYLRLGFEISNSFDIFWKLKH